MIIALATKATKTLRSRRSVLYVPGAPEELLPILEIVPLQLLAYHVAVRPRL